MKSFRRQPAIQFEDTRNNLVLALAVSMNNRLFFSVGEPSGDLHAANLIRALRIEDPTCSVRGFGGLKMTQAGSHCDFDLTTMAVVGFAEVIPKLREFFRIADMAEDVFRQGECDGVV